MFAALAQRVVVLPSTALPAAQQLPDEDAVTGLCNDSNESAAGLLAEFATAALNIAIRTAATVATIAKLLCLANETSGFGVISARR